MRDGAVLARMVSRLARRVHPRRCRPGPAGILGHAGNPEVQRPYGAYRDSGAEAAMRVAWIGMAALLSGCGGLGGGDASAPMTSVIGAPAAMQNNGMMVHSAGSGASISSDLEDGGSTASQSGTNIGAGGIGGGIPQ
ncbi:MAG: hypothetical protein ACRYGC_10245 [Janthinobacterium lividum]